MIYTPLAGEPIEKAAQKAIAIARTHNEPVSFIFNGIECHVTETDSVADIERKYFEARERKRAEWCASPEGIAYQTRQKHLLQEMQDQHDKAMASLPEKFSSGADAVKWIISYADPADHIDVVGKDYRRVADVLKASGFKRSDALGLPKERYESDPYLLLRWFLGQVIDQLDREMPPYNNMVHIFADKVLEGLK